MQIQAILLQIFSFILRSPKSLSDKMGNAATIRDAGMRQLSCSTAFSQQHAFEIQGAGDVKDLGMIPVLEQILQDFYFGSGFHGCFEGDLLEIFEGYMMGTGKKSQIALAFKEPEAGKSEAPEPSHGVVSAVSRRCERRRVQYDEIISISCVALPIQKFKGVGSCEMDIAEMIQSGVFFGLIESG
jgi:hypothetical protein